MDGEVKLGGCERGKGKREERGMDGEVKLWEKGEKSRRIEIHEN